MLNKEVCYQCLVKWHKAHCWPYQEATNPYHHYRPWVHINEFERQWIKGLAPCLKRASDDVYDVISNRGSLPDFCSYELEHLLNGDEV
jgi:hypothetical protein